MIEIIRAAEKELEDAQRFRFNARTAEQADDGCLLVDRARWRLEKLRENVSRTAEISAADRGQKSAANSMASR